MRYLHVLCVQSMCMHHFKRPFKQNFCKNYNLIDFVYLSSWGSPGLFLKKSLYQTARYVIYITINKHYENYAIHLGAILWQVHTSGTHQMKTYRLSEGRISL